MGLRNDTRPLFIPQKEWRDWMLKIEKKQGMERRERMEKRVKAMKWKVEVRGTKREAIASLKALILCSFVRWETSLCCVFKHKNYYRHPENILIAVSDFRNSNSRKRHTDFFFKTTRHEGQMLEVCSYSFIAPHHTHTLTFRRQALVTTCLGSTTSTRGSLMATLRMQLMSKPYTFSHPARAHTHTPHKIISSGAPTWKHVRHSMRFMDFYFLNFHSLSAPAKLSVWPEKTGRRESTTSA